MESLASIQSCINRQKWFSSFKQMFLYFIMIILAVSQLFPLVWMIDYSLVKSGDLFGDEFMKIPQPIQWINYQKAWVDGKILQFCFNSVIIVGCTVIFAVLFSYMLAYACTRMEWKLRGLVYGFVLMAMMIPIHATLLPNFLLFKQFGLLDTYLGVIIPYVAFQLPFNTLVFTGFLSTVHRALEEAALIDGCTIWGVMFKIIAPITKPAIITVSIMTFINYWNEFIMANTFLSTEALKTLPFSVFKFVGEYSSNYAVIFACMVLVALPSILIYLFLSKYITSGVTMGAVKG